MSRTKALEEVICQRLRINVRTHRIAAGLSLKMAAERGDLHWRHWQKIEQGRINITLHTLVRLALVLGVDGATLLREPVKPVH